MIVAKRKAWKAWDPTQMTTHLWLDAKNGTYITESGGLVSQWDDRSGNARHVYQDTGDANKPTYASDTVTFDGISQYLYNTSTFMYNNGNISVAVVGAVSTVGTDDRLICEGSSTNNQPLYAFETHSTDASQMCMYIRNDAGGNERNHTPLSLSGAFNNTQRIYVWGDTGSRLMGYFNGAGAVHADYTRAGVHTTDRFGLGAVVRAAIAAWLACAINEVIITSFMDIQSRQLMEGYLAWKWGLEASLPASHPFRSQLPRLPLAP